MKILAADRIPVSRSRFRIVFSRFSRIRLASFSFVRASESSRGGSKSVRETGAGESWKSRGQRRADEPTGDEGASGEREEMRTGDRAPHRCRPSRGRISSSPLRYRRDDPIIVARESRGSRVYIYIRMYARRSDGAFYTARKGGRENRTAAVVAGDRQDREPCDRVAAGHGPRPSRARATNGDVKATLTPAATSPSAVLSNPTGMLYCAPTRRYL